MFGNTPKLLANTIIKHKWWFLLGNIVLFFIVVGSFMARGMEYGEHNAYMEHIRNNPLDIDTTHVSPPPIFDGDYHVWFDADNPELVAYDKFQKVFAKEENLIVVVNSKSGDMFTEDNLTSLKWITDQSWTIPYVVRVDGMTNFNYTYVDEDDLLVEDFIDEVPTTKDELMEKKKLALEDPLMPNFLVSKKGDVTQLQMRVIIPADFPNGYMEARKSIEKIVSYVTQQKVQENDSTLIDSEYYNPDLTVRLSGTVMLNTSFQQFAMDDLANLFPLMILVVIIVLIIVIRSFWGTVMPMMLLLTSVMFPITLFVGFFYYSLTNATMNVTQMLMAIAIADSVHVLAIFYRGLRNGLDKYDAVRFTVEKNFVPCLITSVTTGIGFYSLMLQDIPPFRDLGLFAGTGAIYAFYASLFTMPALLAIIPFKKRESNVEQVKEYEKHGYEGLTNFIVKFQKPIRWSALFSTIIAIYFVFEMKIDNIAVNYFDEDTEFRQATEFIDNNIIGVNPIEFQFDSGEENGVYSPEYLKKLEKFQEYMSSKPEYEFTYTSSIVDIIKRINKTMNNDDPAYYRIPEENEITADGDTINAKRLIAQYFLLYQMSLPQGMELTNQIDLSNRYSRVTAYNRSISSFELLENATEINEWIAKELPGINAIALGVPVMFGKLMTIAIPSILNSLIVSFVLITIVLMITFKSVKIGLFSMIPNIWPLFITFGAIGILQIPVNMSVAIVGMITLGIAVDDTVHYLTKYLRGKHNGLDQKNAIMFSFRQVAAPLMFTSVILLAGFGSLTQSDFVLNSDMALFCTIVIALALFADFILLPAVILKFDKDKVKKESD